MNKIKQLPLHEAQKIAAGEVVERPANIVKELLENAIDAGATTIKLFIEDGGKQLIRVIDDGCGMSQEDAQLCFNRHATSKISSVNELEKINTFGFRGEALASIAAVAQITLITKEEHIHEGTKVVVEANEIKEKTTIGCATGTDITIAHLFYNIPARKKFLKTTQTEWRQIQLLFNAFCFDYPHIQFLLYNEGKQVLNCPKTDNIKTRCMQLWEKNGNQHLIELTTHKTEQFTIEGVISNHQHYRYDKSGIYLFVNKRWVKNTQLSNALVKGYLNVIPQGRFPLGIIHITIDPQLVDINIHPRKEEVKFLHPRRIEQALQNAVKQTLEQNLSKQIKKDVAFKSFDFDNFFEQQSPKTISTPSLHPTQSQPIFENKFIDEKKEDSNLPPFALPARHPVHRSFTEGESFSEGESAQTYFDKLSMSAKKMTDVSKGQTKIVNKINEPEKDNFQLIGQYKKTYLLIEKEDGLFLVDQHAAHERILYELFATRFDDVATVQLLFPQTITLSQHDIELITPHLELLHHNGIIIEQSARDQLIIQSTPVHLKDVTLDDLIKNVIGWIVEFKSLDVNEFKKTLHEKLRAQMACKAAVKAGDVLTHEQMQQLLHDLEKTNNRFSCPHGRPTGWLLTVHEIEKKFKRKL